MESVFRSWAGAVLSLLVAAAVAAAFDIPHDFRADPPAADNDITGQVIVFLEHGTDANAFAAARGLTVKQALRSDPDAFVLEAGPGNTARSVQANVALDRRVRWSFVNERTAFRRMAFVPDDPYFHRDTPTVGWPGQWHLLNGYIFGRDARVQGAWNRDITGLGVTIGIVDDSLQRTHPDLAPNYSAGDSWDFGGNDADPSPVHSSDNHGTAVGGVAGARGGNGIGVTGAAPHAGLAGLRIDFQNQTTQMFVDATLYHSSGANTSIKVKNHSYGYDEPYITTTSSVSALVTSAAAGTIHCFSAGNYRGGTAQDANTLDLQNSPEVITVAAMGSNGRYSSYSNFGACVTVACPSNTAGGYGITTTDRTGESYGYNGSDSFPDSDYTSGFGGTSSASPVAAGVMALVKQAQPDLDVRFAKHLLALTSNIVDSTDSTYESDGGWQTNAAGFQFNQNYGFGLIDADELTSQAPAYSGVTPLATESTGTVIVYTAIPDNDPAGLSRTFGMTSTTPLEEVSCNLYVTHASRGQLEAYLTSPAGTSGRILSKNTDDSGDNINWTFVSNAFWGENPAGTWTVRVVDTAAGTTGTLRTFAATMRMGSLIPSAQSPPYILVQPAPQSVDIGGTAQFTVQVGGAEPLSFQWQKDAIDLSDGPKISGAATATLTVTGCDVSDVGAYRCVVSNGYGTTTSADAGLTLRFAPADFDQDGDVDASDYGHLQLCYSGYGVPQDDPACQDAKLNDDNYVESLDFAVFLDCLSGPDVPADPDCAAN